MPRYRGTAASLKALALAQGQQATTRMRWRQGTRTSPDNPAGDMAGFFLALRIRPAGRNVRRDEDGLLPERWLLAEWPPEANEPTDYWVSDLPADTLNRPDSPGGC